MFSTGGRWYAPATNVLVYGQRADVNCFLDYQFTLVLHALGADLPVDREGQEEHNQERSFFDRQETKPLHVWVRHPAAVWREALATALKAEGLVTWCTDDPPPWEPDVIVASWHFIATAVVHAAFKNSSEKMAVSYSLPTGIPVVLVVPPGLMPVCQTAAPADVRAVVSENDELRHLLLVLGTVSRGFDIVHAGTYTDLSSTECAVMAMLLMGKEMEDIADYFGYTLGTVRNCCSRIYKKFGVKNRTELIFKML